MHVSFSLTVGRNNDDGDRDQRTTRDLEGTDKDWDIISEDEIARIPKCWGQAVQLRLAPTNTIHPLPPHFNEQSDCRLFTLPSEIRLQIYEHVFHLNPRQASLNCPCHGSSNSPSVLSLLQTCRRVHNETETLFYALNRPTIKSEHLQEFINSLGPRRLAAVSRLNVLVGGEADAYHVLSVCKYVPRLKSLYLTTRISLRYVSIRAWRVMAKQMKTAIAGMEGLEEVRLLVPRAEKDRTEEDERKEREFEKYCQDIGQALKDEKGPGLMLQSGHAG